MLSHRDRVLLSLNHETPDRVPIDLGGTQTSILVQPYEKLKESLGLSTPTETQNKILGLARVEPEILKALDIDLYHVLPGMPDDWELVIHPDDSFYDDWGVRWQRPTGGYYYDMVEHPLSEGTLEAVEAYRWPDPIDPGRTAGVREELARLRKTTDYALEAGALSIWESSWFLVGLETWLLSLRNLDFIEAVMDGVLKVLKSMHAAYLRQAGAYLDIVTLWDDYGTQRGPIISPKDWRRLVKPRLSEIIDNIRSYTAARIGLHSCGSLRAILDDLVEVGVEVLNPVQVTARGMQPEELKSRYGNRLSFWGGIDTQRLLPYGRPSEVAQIVRDTINELGRSGGYILASVHNIQPGTPVENIMTMYKTARNVPLK
jgi:uroporphyrinogen decarboxylase